MHTQHSPNYSPFVADTAGEIRFIPLTPRATIHSGELQRRAASRSTGKYTRHFIAMENSTEVAFVSLDLLPVEDALAIYEIYIPAALRGHGIGGKLLDEIEAMAKQQGYSKVRLAARPMGEFAQPRLAQWYGNRGYLPPKDSVSTIVLEKKLK